MAKNKVIKHVLGQVMELIKKWQKNSYDGNTYPIVDGIIFSNTGSKGREPSKSSKMERECLTSRNS